MTEHYLCDQHKSDIQWNRDVCNTSGKRLKCADIVRVMFSSGYKSSPYMYQNCQERIKVFHWSGKCLLYYNNICLNVHVRREHFRSDYTSNVITFCPPKHKNLCSRINLGSHEVSGTSRRRFVSFYMSDLHYLGKK